MCYYVSIENCKDFLGAFFTFSLCFTCLIYPLELFEVNYKKPLFNFKGDDSDVDDYM